MTKRAKKSGGELSAVERFDQMVNATKSIDLNDIRVQTDHDQLVKPHPHIPTGSVCIDYLIGGRLNSRGIAPCPGVPRGKFTQVYGWNSSGKTTFALTTAATTASLGGATLFVDLENELDVGYASDLGVPVTNGKLFRLIQPNTLEETFACLKMGTAAGFDLIVIDSVAAGVTNLTFNLTTDQIAKGDTGRLGKIAAAWADWLPAWKPQVKRAQTAVIGISQLRQSPGKTEPTVAGGEAWKFFSSVRIRLTRVGWEKGAQYDAMTHTMQKDGIVGAVTRARLDKCKVSDSQRREQDFYISHGMGIDDEHSILDIAVAHKVVKKSGSWLSWDNHKFQSIGKTLQFLRDNQDEFMKLYNKTTPHITGTKIAHGNEIIIEDSDDIDESGQDPFDPAKVAADVDELLGG